MLQAETLAGAMSPKALLGRQIGHLGIKIQLPLFLLWKALDNIGDTTGIKSERKGLGENRAPGIGFSRALEKVQQLGAQ